MVSLDDAVLARLEKGGKRYEILVDPDLVDTFKNDPSGVEVDEFFAMDEVFHAMQEVVRDPLQSQSKIPLELKILWK